LDMPKMRSAWKQGGRNYMQMGKHINMVFALDMGQGTLGR
jgi:hypothetical protein